MNSTEDMMVSCASCDHTKIDHFRPVENPDFKNDEKVRAGVCKEKSCDCKKYIPKLIK